MKGYRMTEPVKLLLIFVNEADLWNHRVECLDNNLTRAQFTDDSFQHTGPLGHAYHDALDSFNRLPDERGNL